MTDRKFLKLVQWRIAGLLPPSAFRNLGPAGTKARTKLFLANPRLLGSFANAQDERGFRTILNRKTIELRRILSDINGAERSVAWGAARKFLNIFLFESAMNVHLSKQYELTKLEPWLEVPLDKSVGSSLDKEPENAASATVLRWGNIIGLNQATSHQYQELAKAVAKRENIHRFQLDLLYYGMR